MKTIYGDYKIDNDGNIYSKRGVLKTKKEGRHYRVNINQKWVSYARVEATFLVSNEFGYDRLLFKDNDSLNCHPKNLKWVSEKEYQDYVYSCQMKGKVNTVKSAIDKVRCPVLKQYYQTGDISIVNDLFVQISKEISVQFWKEISGYVYIKVVERLQRFTLLYDMKIFILARLNYYNQNKWL